MLTKRARTAERDCVTAVSVARPMKRLNSSNRNALKCAGSLDKQLKTIVVTQCLDSNDYTHLTWQDC